ncbi:MAG: AtpZ/AtpI family protein [Pseudomonadota bacterium]
MSEDPDRRDLDALQDRIDAAKDARVPKRSGPNKYEATSLAWRMVLELVIGMVLGCAIGYGLDTLFGTLPIFLMVFAVLGFIAGVRTMMRSAEEARRQRPREERDGGSG